MMKGGKPSERPLLVAICTGKAVNAFAPPVKPSGLAEAQENGKVKMLQDVDRTHVQMLDSRLKTK